MIRNKLLWKNNQQQYGLVSKFIHLAVSPSDFYVIWFGLLDGWNSIIIVNGTN